MTEVRQFKLTGPLETKELVDERQTLEVKLALLCHPPPPPPPPSPNTSTATAATNVSTTATTATRKGCSLKVH